MRRRSWSWIVLTALAAGCASQPAAAERRADPEVVRGFFRAVFDEHRVAAVDDFCAADFVENDAPPGVPHTREGVKGFFADWNKAFPDTRVVCEDFIIEGEKLVCRSTWTGTFKGDFLGMKANGKTFHVETIDILRFANGKVAEHWGLTDMATLMEQLK